MPVQRLRATHVQALLERGSVDFAAVRETLGITPDYPAAAVAEAEDVARRVLADLIGPPRLDRRDLPLVTLDPVGSRDLDQAMLLQGNAFGYRVWYAIADVAAFVVPGEVLDAETRRRGETLYSPDLRTPLHPVPMSEGAASLLPEAERPAVLWTIDLDEQALPTAVTVARAVVRSTAQLDYPTAQQDTEAGRLHPSIALLPEIGRLRQLAARQRHAISLDLPDAEIEPTADGHWTLRMRAVLDIESYNAEISLLTGMCAANLMLSAGVGVLRTLPVAAESAVAELRRSAAALGIGWPAGMPPGDVIATVDPATGKGAAFLEDAVRLLRGAGYTSFRGTPPERPGHAGVGAPYAHVTAPLRRLVDRFGSETCLAIAAGRPVPEWVLQGLPDLDSIMARSGRLAGELERAEQWAVTAFVLGDRLGQEFAGTVVQIDERQRATVLLDEPPVRAHCPADGLAEGQSVRVRLTALEDASRTVAVAVVAG